MVIALVRAGMVYGNKFLWESLIFKKLWSISQEANWIKQKQSTEKRKLEQMQKPTSVQLDEKVEEKTGLILTNMQISHQHKLKWKNC